MRAINFLEKCEHEVLPEIMGDLIVALDQDDPGTVLGEIHLCYNRVLIILREVWRDEFA